MEIQKTNNVEPKIFRMFMIVKQEISSPRPIQELREHELVALIADQIKFASDETGLSLLELRIN
jgi:hypothetical protein